MSRLEPLSRKNLSSELEAMFVAGDSIMGFTPNDALVMAHKPELLKAVLALIQAVYAPGTVDLALKKLLAVMTSSAAGCQYCTAHTQYGALNEDVAATKLAAIWEYEHSELFSDAERAALDVARSAAQTPNTTTDEGFSKLRRHFSDAQVVEIVAVISMFGFLNRWNSTLATELEQVPQTLLQQNGLLGEKA